MVIWLRNPQAEGTGLGVGIGDGVLRREGLATIVELDHGYAEMQRQCEAALAAARAGADALLEQARAQAGALVARAEDDYANAERRGYEAGLQRGLADWHARAAQVHADASTLERKARDRLAELVALAVEQIVASADPKALFARAAATVEQIVADGSPVHLRVHPADAAAAGEAFRAIASSWREAGRAVRLQVTADATLAPGACLAETDLGTLDASLSLHLAAMRDALARAVRSLAETDSADAVGRENGEGGEQEEGGTTENGQAEAIADTAELDAVPT
ncbi:HrpE/YscL family type III secretion apparatus protein [Trinickia dabaoshanensis]|uniref:Type 3 secretion system stator protein n=1 Tax=Trinickia dabaoshanensis TaxID=564714 RepID=A0A2N7VZI0_9BURK|nr:type III secretion system stator protein SctL [Trinickia dabaoshanensis]PMS22558.1 HrpE/YscL family type III secretion apparatus protein [Trinickia dabaoshanensis]